MGVTTADVVAVACILGSGMVGGAVTLAALDRGGGDDAAHVARVVVVDVDGDVRIRLEEARVRMEEARIRMDEARARAEEVRVRMDGELKATVQRTLQEELRRLERELARLEEGTGR